MGPPRQPPIGLALAGTAKRVGRAFDAALAREGGSRPVWLILMALKLHRPQTQRELAEAVGIEGATLTRHLDAMQRAGLVQRTQVADNRRVQRVELTEDGERLFLRLRTAAGRFDAQLRTGLDQEDVDRLRGLLAKLEANSASPSTARSPREPR